MPASCAVFERSCLKDNLVNLHEQILTAENLDKSLITAKFLPYVFNNSNHYMRWQLHPQYELKHGINFSVWQNLGDIVISGQKEQKGPITVWSNSHLIHRCPHEIFGKERFDKWVTESLGINNTPAIIANPPPHL